MALKIKPAGKIVLVAVIVAIVVLLAKWYQARPKDVSQSVEVGKVALPDAPEASLSGNATKLPLPSSETAVNGGTQINWERMAWNSQFSGMYANGGTRTTKTPCSTRPNSTSPMNARTTATNKWPTW